jgi:hypothetical protein
LYIVTLSSCQCPLTALYEYTGSGHSSKDPLSRITLSPVTAVTVIFLSPILSPPEVPLQLPDLII